MTVRLHEKDTAELQFDMICRGKYDVSGYRINRRGGKEYRDKRKKEEKRRNKYDDRGRDANT